MTEQQKKQEEEKSKYYFKIIPKEEFPKFMERLQEALKKTDNKKGDKKCIEFEVRGSNEELNGLSLEIFTFDKSRCAEFLDESQDYISKALYCVSLNINVKEEADVAKLEEAYNKLLPMFSNIPHIKDKCELKFRHKGKQVSFDVVAKDGKLIQALMNLGIDLTDYHKFNFALKSGINLAEILNPAADQSANLVKICSLLFSIKSETENVRYLSGALAEALKDVKLNNEKIQAKFNKVVGYLNFINSFIGAKLKLEYDAKVLAGEGAKEAEKKAGGSEDLKMKISGAQQMAMGMGSQMVAPMIATMGFADTIKALDLDSISISLGVPKYHNGYAISIKIPGLSSVLGGMLEQAAGQPGK